MTPKLAFEHLTKSYKTVRAVDDLSLEVLPGCIFGLLGRNGAGKTTTISCALGLTHPDSGAVWFDGRTLQSDTLAGIAYVPETLALAGWMTPREYVEFHRRVYKRFDVLRARELVELFNVPFDRTVRKLSKGQQASIALVLAFAQRADLVFLDEPASGLDPHAQLRLLDVIIQAAAEGTTVMFSSHQIAHIERAAEEVAIIDRGKVVVRGNVDELRLRHKVSLEDIFLTAVPAADGEHA
jgi:ABC-2 type transport system ATP-binding protein